MKNTFSNDIQAVHRTTRFLLKTVLVIFCMAILVVAAQGITDSIIRIADDQTPEFAAQSTSEHTKVNESATPPASKVTAVPDSHTRTGR